MSQSIYVLDVLQAFALVTSSFIGCDAECLHCNRLLIPKPRASFRGYRYNNVHFVFKNVCKRAPIDHQEAKRVHSLISMNAYSRRDARPRVVPHNQSLLERQTWLRTEVYYTLLKVWPRALLPLECLKPVYSYTINLTNRFTTRSLGRYINFEVG